MGIFVEAESFKNLGGWGVDQQSLRQMGSAYLIAHGNGIPVEDAETKIEVPEFGTWHVWVRTRDWTAIWGRGSPGGVFQLLVNGAALPSILGTNGTKWDWQKAGAVTLREGKASLALHDLTGFNGRCDAIYLTKDASFTPPNGKDELATFRDGELGIVLKDDPVEYDLVVAGGGVAGVCTAVSAIRSGLKVVILQDRGVLGGCNSSEIRVGLGGMFHSEPYMNLGNVVKEIAPIFGGHGTYSGEFFEDSRKANIFRLHEKDGNRLILNHHVVEVETAPDDPQRIVSVIAVSTLTGERTRFKGKQFADCTGDALLARALGCEYMYGTELRDTFNELLAPVKGSNQVMGQTLTWRSSVLEDVEPFPEIDWGHEINETNAYFVRGGDWEWESGQYRDHAEEAEYIRDYGLMTIFTNWSFLKNRSGRKDEWANAKLEWISPIGGKRESYRVVGDLILTQNHIEDFEQFPDRSAAMTWDIDLHYPDPDNEAMFKEPFRSCAYHRGIEKPFPVPYRCLYARDVKNLLLGGRHISVSHVALACVRVMKTLGALGEVIGMAASICVKENCDPRDVYEKHLDQLIALMEKGVPSVLYHGGQPKNNERYHFKDEGWFEIYPKFTVPVDNKKIVEKIKKLGVTHKNPHPPF